MKLQSNHLDYFFSTAAQILHGFYSDVAPNGSISFLASEVEFIGKVAANWCSLEKGFAVDFQKRQLSQRKSFSSRKFVTPKNNTKKGIFTGFHSRKRLHGVPVIFKLYASVGQEIPDGFSKGGHVEI